MFFGSFKNIPFIKTNIPSAALDREKLEPSYIVGRDRKCCRLFGKQSRRLNIGLLHDSAVPLLVLREK